MNKNTVLATIGVIGALIALVITIGMTTANGEINQNQSVLTAKANISKEEQRRVDLFNNLVDSIKSYNNYEADTQSKIIDARSKATNGNVDDAAKALSIVVERYPELKSQKNYQQAMKEFSITENRLSNYREDYNSAVRNYNVYVSKFPKKQILNFLGVQPQRYEQLDFKVDNKKATNLFK